MNIKKIYIEESCDNNYDYCNDIKQNLEHLFKPVRDLLTELETKYNAKKLQHGSGQIVNKTKLQHNNDQMVKNYMINKTKYIKLLKRNI